MAARAFFVSAVASVDGVVDVVASVGVVASADGGKTKLLSSLSIPSDAELTIQLGSTSKSKSSKLLSSFCD